MFLCRPNTNVKSMQERSAWRTALMFFINNVIWTKIGNTKYEIVCLKETYKEKSEIDFPKKYVIVTFGAQGVSTRDVKFS